MLNHMYNSNIFHRISQVGIMKYDILQKYYKFMIFNLYFTPLLVKIGL